MPLSKTPIEFVRELDNGNEQLAGNNVRLEDGNASPISATNPLPVSSEGLPIALGQEIMANSMPVVIASDQSAIPVSGTVTITPSGTQDTSIIKIAGSTIVIPTDSPVALPVSIEWFGNSVCDVFNRLRVAQPETIFDSKQIADNQPLFWDDQSVSGSGTSSTYNAYRASTTLGVGNLTAGKRVRQTFSWHNYQPGKSQEVTMTGVIGASQAGITREWGLFHNQNGLFFRQDSGGIKVVRRTNVTATPADDPSAYLNLTLSNGVTINPAMGNIWFIAFEWLGVGDVLFGVFYGRKHHILAVIENSNNLSSVYMSSPNLPLRYSIENDGSGSASTLETICSCVVSNGGKQESGANRSVDRGITQLTTLNNSSIYPLVAIRKKVGYEGASIIPSKVTVMCTSTAQFRWCILLNPTVVGTALSFSSVTNSAIEADVSITSATTVTGGIQLVSDYGQQTNNSESAPAEGIPSRIRLGTSIAGIADILVLGVQRITGTTESFFGVLDWREEI